MADGKGIFGRSGADQSADGDDESGEHAPQPVRGEDVSDVQGSDTESAFPLDGGAAYREGLQDHQAETVEAHRRGDRDSDGSDGSDGGDGPYPPSDPIDQPFEVSRDAAIEQLQRDVAQLTSMFAQLTGIVQAKQQPPPEDRNIHSYMGYTIVWDDSYKPSNPYKVLDENGRCGATSDSEEHARHLLERLIQIRTRNEPGWP